MHFLDFLVDKRAAMTLTIWISRKKKFTSIIGHRSGPQVPEGAVEQNLPQIFVDQFTLLTGGGQINPIVLALALLPPPDFRTLLRPCRSILMDHKKETPVKVVRIHYLQKSVKDLNFSSSYSYSKIHFRTLHISKIDLSFCISSFFKRRLINKPTNIAKILNFRLISRSGVSKTDSLIQNILNLEIICDNFAIYFKCA